MLILDSFFNMGFLVVCLLKVSNVEAWEANDAMSELCWKVSFMFSVILFSYLCEHVSTIFFFQFFKVLLDILLNSELTSVMLSLYNCNL